MMSVSEAMPFCLHVHKGRGGGCMPSHARATYICLSLKLLQTTEILYEQADNKSRPINQNVGEVRVTQLGGNPFGAEKRITVVHISLDSLGRG